ncbi:MAG TPA: hypothetical protein VLH77_00765 [Gammaproteobacteria bacterium]|nr:hypothetical protein [Gammaproteobacteria bacterium]
MSTSRTKDLSTLGNLPMEAKQQVIYPLSPLSTLGFLAQTSSHYETETAALRLLQAAIHATPVLVDAKEDENVTALAAIAILKRHPELLFMERQMVTDHYGRKILASPYQIFLGAGDIWALRQIHEDILPRIKNGKAQAETHFKEQFPNCPWPPPEDLKEALLYDDRNKLQIAEIVKQLVLVKECIDADPFNNNELLDTTKLAVKTLGQLFQPKPEKVIKSGLHFPPVILGLVYYVYNALEEDHWPFFSRTVIKPALDALSTVDGQCCQYGLINLDMMEGPSRRCDSSYQHPLGQPLSLSFTNDRDKRCAALVDPYDGDVLFVSSAGVFDCFTKYGRELGAVRWRWLARAAAPLVGILMENKQKLMGAMMQPLAEKSTLCAIV